MHNEHPNMDIQEKTLKDTQRQRKENEKAHQMSFIRFLVYVMEYPLKPKKTNGWIQKHFFLSLLHFP